MRRLHAILLLLAVATAGCGEDQPDLPTAPSVDTSTAINELFEGVVNPGATLFYSFRVTADRNVTLMLASLVGADARPLDVPVELGFGIPQGTGCGLIRTTSARPGLQAQIDYGTTAGTYCVNLSGTSGLSGPATFAIRIRHEPSELPDAAPAVVSFASQLALGGFSTRSFPATRKGTASVTLESLSQSGARVGVGLGLQPLSGAGCHLSRMVEVEPGGGPHLSMPVDIGTTFCVSVIDVGQLTSSASFNIRIDHP
jgi:hypothetical protein